MLYYHILRATLSLILTGVTWYLGWGLFALVYAADVFFHGHSILTHNYFTQKIQAARDDYEDIISHLKKKHC
jgi:hypothetical protein